MISRSPPVETMMSKAIGAALALVLSGLALPPSALAAEAVVVASTAPGYAQGELVPDGRPVTVPDGANALFLFANGRMVRIKGPFEGTLDKMPEASSWTGVGSLVGGERFFQTDLGAARGINSPLQKGAEQVFAIDPGVAGTQCVKAGGTALLQKPQDPSLVPTTLRESGRDGGRGGSATVRWDKGMPVPWPKDIALKDGAELSVAGPDGKTRHTLRLRVVDDGGDGAALAVRLAQAGCTAQAAALLTPVRDSMAPLNLYLSTDRGLYPTYKAGDPVTLVLQTNRDAHVYCYVRNARGQLTPIFPAGPSASSLVEGHHTLSLPGDRMPMPLRVGDPSGGKPGDLEVRCFAAGRDLGNDLPGRRDAFRPMSDEAAARLEQTLNSLRQTDLVMAQVILRAD
ncbi:DUF4384 domain-containing protein [Azospirillum sp. sgz302134]